MRTAAIAASGAAFPEVTRAKPFDSRPMRQIGRYEHMTAAELGHLIGRRLASWGGVFAAIGLAARVIA